MFTVEEFVKKDSFLNQRRSWRDSRPSSSYSFSLEVPLIAPVIARQADGEFNSDPQGCYSYLLLYTDNFSKNVLLFSLYSIKNKYEVIIKKFMNLELLFKVSKNDFLKF